MAPGPARRSSAGSTRGLARRALGHHFARPGNRFWPLLHAAGFTDRVLGPTEEAELLERRPRRDQPGQPRRPRAADELTREDLRAGAARLEETCRRWRPAIVAVLGMGAFRTAFPRPQGRPRRAARAVGGARAWLLPNPSGLQARYQMPELVDLVTALRRRRSAPRW